MELGYPAIEHGSGRTGRVLRAQRLRIALLVALVEGALVVVGVVPGLVALAAAAAVLAFHLTLGRRSRSYALRQLSSAAALSQAFVALVPVLALVLTALALVALAVLAVLALVVLAAVLASRR